ncbi:septation protein SepH [Jongsikchunia kroppenstedtii]|uniref:septation protein SepH n=1 Tax=Jongsikchunia kroppenstedtii TaxID=1121721 RepID=UPI00039A798D|nr:septation protein SepH [Jongsikchunia kroppenstedtii]
MRELSVVGLGPDGKHVICADPESGDQFRIPADDRLRAAARGDLTRMGQIEIEMESSLRPKEIQSRIRAGASVEEVASLAGVSADRVARFAHPVLLERSRAAEMASQAHPIRQDGPANSTLSEIVAAALGARGVSPDDTSWDAFKSDADGWVVEVTWIGEAGDGRARWSYSPGSHGGTVHSLDELAFDLVDPDLSRPLSLPTPPRTLKAVPAMPPVPAPAPTREHHPQLDYDSPLPHRHERVEEITVPADRITAAQTARRREERDEAVAREQEQRPTATPAPEKPAAPPQQPAAHDDKSDQPDQPAEKRPKRRGKAKPAVPAWEDVLLGVRSSGEQ